MPDKKDNPDLLEQIRQLEQKVRQLESGSNAGADPGLAKGLVTALGRLVPGLQKLIDVGSQMPEFQQQLAAIDDEIKRKFKEQPLRSAAVTFARNLQRRSSMGIPPSVRKGRLKPDAAGKTADKPRGGYRRKIDPKVRLTPETPSQLHADVFDEGRYVVVLAEAPGLAADHVTATLEGDSMLIVTIDDPRRAGCHRIELPCPAAGEPQVSLGNGILKIRLSKEHRP